MRIVLQRSAFVIATAFLALTALGCGRFGGSNEVVLPSTEVGSPIGEKTTKNVGPSGGVLLSKDGKLKLTIPPGTLTQDVLFGITPVSSKTENSVAGAYRLEPDGLTFASPVEIQFLFDENDLAGTVPEALFVAYQDKQGAWRGDTSSVIDPESRAISIKTTHFTDFLTFTQIRIVPAKVRLRVSNMTPIRLLECRPSGILDMIDDRPITCGQPPSGTAVWSLEGPGQIDGSDRFEKLSTMFTNYSAPSRKPNPPTAIVKVRATFSPWNSVTGERTTTEKVFESHITIVGDSYKATGSWGGITFSGTVCSLDAPFFIQGQSNFLTFNFAMVPSGSGESGTVAITGGGSGVSINGGSGSYTVTGTDTESPRITLSADSFTGSYPGAGSAQGGGTRIIQLVPFETKECGGNQ